MKIPLMLLCAVVVAAPVRADPVLWFDSGALTSVDGTRIFPGLSVGTPWTLTLGFDPEAPGRPGFPSIPDGSCNIYPVSSATFTLGSFTYTNSGGQIWTNSNLPGSECTGSRAGAIQFEFVRGWTQEPGAWNLNQGLLIAQYTDVVNDGSLPASPNPRPDTVTGQLNFYDLFGLSPFPAFQDSSFTPRLLVDNPTPVPEPGTMAMLGMGLALGARRWRRGRKN